MVVFLTPALRKQLLKRWGKSKKETFLKFEQGIGNEKVKVQYPDFNAQIVKGKGDVFNRTRLFK